MTLDAFHLLPMHPGWKNEYFAGQAHITPRHTVALARIDIEPRTVATPCEVREVTRTDESGLIEAFLDAFHDSVEYCDWTLESITAEAARCIREFFTSRRGTPHPASRLVIGEAGEVEGAALIVRCPHGPELKPLFVRPRTQRRGLGSALVAAAMNVLHASGETRLGSGYDLANEASVRWHRRFGFVELPDLLIARLRLRCAEHELWRRQTLGDLAPAERDLLAVQCARLSRQVEALEERAEREGFEAVAPLLRPRC